MDGGQWSSGSRRNYNLRDTVAQSQGLLCRPLGERQTHFLPSSFSTIRNGGNAISGFELENAVTDKISR
ncbi:hypothetical protein ZOSMA_22G01330 [Zostera marina]|uniref:Uncharacterized protein n=1 Tax=Zostera marina TaxID=29655 RepID=A0A0K9PIE3_ZOSMR|nr:hypothetical protein ZOSMA_22G01330 [Zostera marina]